MSGLDTTGKAPIVWGLETPTGTRCLASGLDNGEVKARLVSGLETTAETSCFAPGLETPARAPLPGPRGLGADSFGESGGVTGRNVPPGPKRPDFDFEISPVSSDSL